MSIRINFLFFPAFVLLVSLSSALSQEREGELPRLRNPLPPEQYLEQYNYVRDQMPDEFQLSKGKQPMTSHQWESIGPSRIKGDDPKIFYDGRVRSFHWYYDSASSSWGPYLGASSGGFWKGLNLLLLRAWQSIGNNLPNPSVGAFVIHPQNRERMIVGTGDWARYNGAGVFRTSDGGASWQTSTLYVGASSVVPRYITDIFYHPLNSSVVWLSSDFGIFKSIDGGISFYRAGMISPPWSNAIFDMVMDRSHPETMYVATGWNNDTSTSYGIWRTTNAGTTWEHLTTGLPTSGLPTSNLGSTISLDISKSNPSVLYSVFSDSLNNLNAVYKTTNGGSTWQATATQPNHMISGQGGHVNVVTIHPEDPQKVYVGSVYMRRSTDGGGTWSDAKCGHSDLTVIDFDPTNSRYMYIGNDGGIFVRDDSLNTVRNDVEYFAPGSLIQAYSFDYAWTEPSLIVSGTQDNGTILSRNGLGSETEWDSISGCDGGYSNVIDPLDSKKMYFNTWCGSSTHRIRSLDKGMTLGYINDTLSTPWYPSICMNKMFTNFIFTYTPWYLYYSSNYGSTWTRTHSGGTDFVGTEAPRGFEINSGVSGDTLIGYGTFWDTASKYKVKIAGGPLGAMSWRYSTLPDSSTVGRIQVDRSRGQFAYAFSESGARKVFRTTNGGFTWASIEGNLPAVFKHTLVSKPGVPSTMYVGTDLGVFRTTNGGALWHKYQWGLPTVQIADMVYVPGTGHDTLRIATNGRGYWQRVLDGADPDFLSLAPGLQLHDLASYGSNAIGLSDKGMTIQTSDAGASWNLVETSLPVNQGISFSSPTSLFAVGSGGQLYRSTDAGVNWTGSNVPTQSNLHTIHFMTPFLGFAAGDQGTILRTTDKGNSWLNTTNQFDGAIYDIAFKDTLYGIAAGMTLDANQGKHRLLLVTTDGGASWSPSQVISGNGALNGGSFDGKSFFIVGDAGYAARSTDGGQSWSQLSLPGKPSADFHAVSGIAIPPFGSIVDPELYIGGVDGSIFVSEDHGTTWKELESGVTGSINAFAHLSAGKNAVLSSGTISPSVFVAGESGLVSRTENRMKEVAFSYSGGWNLLSLPVSTEDSSKNSLYPDASSKAFIYKNQYVIAETLTAGRGFWVKFPFEGVQGFVGTAIPALKVPLTKGWNIIGGLDIPIATSSITTSPSNILTSHFFGYGTGYTPAETLKPALGYWIKSSSDGDLLMDRGTPKRGTVDTKIRQVDHGRIEFSSQDGTGASLLFSCFPEEGLSKYELPPAPPGGILDVRYATGFYLEGPAESVEKTVPLVATSAMYPMVVRWNHPGGGAGVWLSVGDHIIRITGEGTDTIREEGALAVHFGKGEPRPTQFQLLQNYPNPFNPLTTIRYDVPVASMIELKVFDVLGRTVTTLREEFEEPGIKFIEWDASALSSGMYFYRLEATTGKEKFTRVKKMILVK